MAHMRPAYGLAGAVAAALEIFGIPAHSTYVIVALISAAHDIERARGDVRT